MKHQIKHSKTLHGITLEIVNEDYLPKAQWHIVFDFNVPTGPGKNTFASLPSNRHPGIVTNVEKTINDGVSLMALENGKLVGICLSHTITRLEVEPKHSFEEYSKHVPKSTAAVRMLCDELLHPGDVFEKYPDVIKIYDIFSMATHPHYRQQGLGRFMLEEALIVAEKADCDAAMALAVSDYASKICINVGMEKFREKEWKDCIYDGIRPYENIQSKIATAYLKKIKN